MSDSRLSPAAAYIVLVMLCGAGLLGIIWGGGTERDSGQAPQIESPPPPAPDKNEKKKKDKEEKPAEPAASANPNAKLVTEDLVVGSGETAESGDTLSMKYAGTLLDGTEFDSTAKHGDQPFKFQIGAGRVIKGWDQGIVGMKVGGKRKLTIPPELGYGARGAGDKIPPNSTLVFNVELVGVEKKK
ncbi:MAG: FKBP-type peptidyl-prolyl cis-trans isomerase [Labilithrix sp.]